MPLPRATNQGIVSASTKREHQVARAPGKLSASDLRPAFLAAPFSCVANAFPSSLQRFNVSLHFVRSCLNYGNPPRGQMADEIDDARVRQPRGAAQRQMPASEQLRSEREL